MHGKFYAPGLGVIYFTPAHISISHMTTPKCKVKTEKYGLGMSQEEKDVDLIKAGQAACLCYSLFATLKFHSKFYLKRFTY